MYRLFAGDMARREQVIEPLSSGERRDKDVLNFIFLCRDFAYLHLQSSLVF